MAKMKGVVQSELHFRVGRVRKVLAHAMGCERHLPMEEGKSAPGAGVVLVVDASIYLASNGQEDGDLDVVDRLVWAEGMRPDQWEDDADLYKRKVQLVGEGDEAVYLKGSDVELVLGMANDWDVFRIAVVHDGKRLRRVLMLPTAKSEDLMRWKGLQSGRNEPV